MAKMLPSYIDLYCKSSAEKKLFNIFKNSYFTKDWIVLHSLNLSQHISRQYGEIDFLILVPNSGIYIMEVKGGKVSCKDGVWTFTDRTNNSNTSYVGPFNQARDAMFSLRNRLKQILGNDHEFNRIITGFICAFPDINFDRESVEYESWQILDKDLIDSNGIESFFYNLGVNYKEKHQNERWFSLDHSIPSFQKLEKLSELLRGDFEKIRTSKEEINDFNKAVKNYTEEQFRVLDHIQDNERCLIQGSAGTGKTMIAMESSIRSCIDGKRVLLTCFNKIIGDWMRDYLKEYKDNITVVNLHSFLIEKIKGIDIVNTHDTDFFSKEVPSLAAKIYEKNIEEKFDKLIIDEGQDLITEEYLNLFDSMLIGGLAKGTWEIYGDFEQQAIFSKFSKQEMFVLIEKYTIPSRFNLKINCRNTKQIGEETSLISGFQTQPFLLDYLEGGPVNYIFFDTKTDERIKLEDALNKVIENNTPLNNIVILSPNKFENSVVSELEKYNIKNYTNYSEFIHSNDTIYFSTIHSFKGMEAEYVFITDIDNLDLETSKSILYIGMSRAKFNLTLFVNNDCKNQYKNLLLKKLS